MATTSSCSLFFFFNLCSSASSSLHRTNSFKRNQRSVFFRLVNLQILVVWNRLSQLYSAVDNNRLSSTPFFHQDQHPDRHLGPYWRWGSGRIYELQGIGARAELRLVGGLGHVSVDDLIHCEGRQTEKKLINIQNFKYIILSEHVHFFPAEVSAVPPWVPHRTKIANSNCQKIKTEKKKTLKNWQTQRSQSHGSDVRYNLSWHNKWEKLFHSLNVPILNRVQVQEMLAVSTAHWLL